jgi:hypothetical protein
LVRLELPEVLLPFAPSLLLFEPVEPELPEPVPEPELEPEPPEDEPELPVPELPEPEV